MAADNVLSDEDITQTAERGNWLIWAPSVLGATIVALRERPTTILKAHIPSVTAEMDNPEEGSEWDGVGPRDDIGDYVGDQRICACGRRIDGFYDYVDHLSDVLA